MIQDWKSFSSWLRIVRMGWAGLVSGYTYCCVLKREEGKSGAGYNEGGGWGLNERCIHTCAGAERRESVLDANIFSVLETSKATLS